MMNIGFFRNLFKEKKLSLSHPRLLIYQELSDALSPLSPSEIYQNLLKKKKKIGLTSIYRSLDLFEGLGVVFKITNGVAVKYKLCELEDHHHYIVCKTCGNVVELNFCDISDWSKKVTESTGYQVTDHQLNFYGYCKACKSSHSVNSNSGMRSISH
jgi:Fur family ferric uptake transcriptional regulator